MRVLAVQAVRQLIGLRFAGHVGARGEQCGDDRRGMRGRRMRRQPLGTAETGPVTGDVVDILDAEGQPGERPRAGAGNGDMRMPAESAQRIVGNLHYRSLPIDLS